MFEVRVKTGHPTGTYRRAGMTFSMTESTKLDAVPKAVRDDPWLVVSKLADATEVGVDLTVGVGLVPTLSRATTRVAPTDLKPKT